MCKHLKVRLQTSLLLLFQAFNEFIIGVRYSVHDGNFSHFFEGFAIARASINGEAGDSGDVDEDLGSDKKS
ncbi:hypothetical protein VNO78_00862 [Psophocarpus tetragonolobus]|uniref:Uncharacterized protein n=1 Tax=Psophocarpus tetragonolobus TaxID=3891 RepID=A0AAN9XU15_PSOTE